MTRDYRTLESFLQALGMVSQIPIAEQEAVRLGLLRGLDACIDKMTDQQKEEWSQQHPELMLSLLFHIRILEAMKKKETDR